VSLRIWSPGAEASGAEGVRVVCACAVPIAERIPMMRAVTVSVVRIAVLRTSFLQPATCHLTVTSPAWQIYERMMTL
jgi:hypothetical protein